MSQASRASHAPGPSPALPDPIVRTVVTLLLVFHLFALGVAALSSSGNVEATSPLALGLRRIPAAYLQLLDMDLNYKFYLTYGDIFDVDQQIELDLTLPDGSMRAVAFPEPGIWPRIREQRYQTLASRVGGAIGNDAESLLPQAISGSYMAPWGATKATFRCRGHFVLNMENVLSPDMTVADPYDAGRYRTLYEAQVVRSDDGTVSLVKTSDDDAIFGEVRGTPATAAPPPSSTAPAAPAPSTPRSPR
jgi:hypothetical protein